MTANLLARRVEKDHSGNHLDLILGGQFSVVPDVDDQHFQLTCIALINLLQFHGVDITVRRYIQTPVVKIILPDLSFDNAPFT
jgi:hypothetical protein